MVYTIGNVCAGNYLFFLCASLENAPTVSVFRLVWFARRLVWFARRLVWLAWRATTLQHIF